MKIFVLTPYLERSNEEIAVVREEALNKILDIYTGEEEVELSLPQGKRLTGDLEAMFSADIVVKVKYANYDPVCQIVEQAAHTYGKYVLEDRFLPHEITDEMLEK